MATSFKRSCASTVIFSAPDPAGSHSQPMPPLETPGHSQASLGESLVGSLLLFSGSWCTILFVPSNSVSPVLCKFCNQIPLASKVKFPGGSQSVPLLDAQVGTYAVGPRSFITVRELWYNCSAVCASSAQWLSDRDNGNLLQKDLGHMPRLPGLLQPEPLCPRQATVDPPCLCRRHSNTHRQVWLSLCGVPGSWCTQGFV